MQDLKGELAAALKKEVPGLKLDESFLDQLDSLQLMSLVTAVEAHFQVRFSPVEIRPHVWGHFEEILKLLESKKK